MAEKANQGAFSKDILQTIFFLLPQQSILNCQCVCKYWFHIISDPLFIQSYRSKHMSLFGFFYTTSLTPPSIHFCPVSETATLFRTVASVVGSIIPYDHQVTFLDSGNGILVFHFFIVSGDNAGFSGYVVINPMTWQKSKLPLPRTLEGEPGLSLVHGFVSGSGDNSPYFEVIRIVRSGRKGLIVSTFSSKTQRWRSKSHVANFLEQWYIDLTGVGILCNGSLHWLCLPIGLVAYNVRTEQFSVIPVPEYQGRLLRESEGCLLYIGIKKNSKCCSVWVLEDYIGMRWCLRYTIDFNKVRIDLNLPKVPNDLYACILAFDPVDADVVVLSLGNKIVLYNLQSLEAKVMCEFRSGDGRLGIFCPFKLPKSPSNWISPAHYSKILSAPAWVDITEVLL